ALASSLDLPDVLDAIAEGAMKLVQANYVTIYLYDEESEEFTLRLGVWETGERKTPPPPRKSGLTAKVIASKEPVVVHSVPEHPLFMGKEGLAVLAHFTELKSVAGIPIRRAEKTLGSFNVSFTRPHTFTQEEIGLLSSLANQVAIVVENAQALAKLRAAYEAQERLLQLVQELSTPLVPLTKEILLLPLVGSIDSQRAQQIMSTLLEGVAGRRARAVIIDITGVPMVDSRVANHLIQAARAAELLGAEVILVGITPQVAQTIVELGIDLSELTPRSELQDGIEYALRLLGRRIVGAKE
ncbi:MAG: GAF domain-containing protein, partial [Anaerolineae bacterium]